MRWGAILGALFVVAILLAQAPKPGAGLPSAREGAPVGIIFTRIGTTTVANTTVETPLLGAGVGTTSLAANVLTPGRMIRIMQRGIINTTLNPTMRYRIYANTTPVMDTGAMPMPGIPANAEFVLRAEIICRTSGATGTLECAGDLTFETTQGQLTVGCNWARVGTVTVNTTIVQTLNSSIQWGTASPSNSISVDMGSVEILN